MNSLAARPAKRRRSGARHARHSSPVFAFAISAVCLAGCAPDGPVELPKPLTDESAVVYPLELWDAGVEGETILMVHVTETGAVDSLYIDQSSGLEEFDSAAVRGGRVMRFTPGLQGGERRSMWTRLPVRFRRATENPSSPAGPRS
jgi:TonB family protein